MLRVADLHNDDKERRRKNKLFYKQILMVIYEKIKELNNRRYKSLNYTLPLFYPGFPLYNPYIGIKYIYKKLIEGGFDVSIIDDRSMIISWS